MDLNKDETIEQEEILTTTVEGKQQGMILFSLETNHDELCFSQIRSFEKFKITIGLENLTEEDLKDFDIIFSASSDFVSEFKDIIIEGSVHKASSSSNIFSKTIEVNLNQTSFKGLTEDATETITAFLKNSQGENIGRQELFVTLKPEDYWDGTPQSLPVFIKRNDPSIRNLLHLVGQAMEQLAGNSALVAYQSQNPDIVKKQCAAIYSVLQNQNLTYTEPLASNSLSGQRIRSCQEIFKNKVATCLDTTLLYCSISECIGLHPIICILEGHAFPGVWLDDTLQFNSVVHDDPSDITQNANQQLCIVESTLLTQHPFVPFEDACNKAFEKAENAENLRIVDVHLARMQRVLPLPYRELAEDGSENYIEDTFSDIEANVPEASVQYDIGEITSADNTPKDRITIWERKLLDFSTKNPLMNMKITGKSLQLLCPEVDKLEDELYSSIQFHLIENPLLIEMTPFAVAPIKERSNYATLMSYFKQKKIPTGETATNLKKKLSHIYRQAQNDLSETGSNTLYLAVGHIEWYEKDNTMAQAYHAPILLYPVSLTRVNSSEYLIQVRDDEEPQLNYSIFEKFKNDFKYTTKLDYENLPHDERGLDVLKIFKEIRLEIANQYRWRLVESCTLGLFSFDQFVMWNDMRKRSDDLANNKIAASLIQNKLTYEPKPFPKVTDADFIEQAIPVSCDESQLKAVKAATEGHSFILQGPPGTGKSQTITAIIVNALAHGEKVLFVAEKMAALQVVYRNLKKVHVDDYTIELHSIKATKTHFIDQLVQALEKRSLAVIPDTANEKQIQDISKELANYVSALHVKEQNGICLYDMIDRLQQFEGIQALHLQFHDIQNVTEDDLKECKIHLQEIALNLKKFCPLKESPYKGLHFQEYDDASQKCMSEIIPAFLSSLETSQEEWAEIINSLPRKPEKVLNPIILYVVEEIAKAGKYLKEKALPIKIVSMNDFSLESGFIALKHYREKSSKMVGSIALQWNLEILNKSIPELLRDWSDCKDGFFKRKQRKEMIKNIGAYYLDGDITEENIESKLRELNRTSSEKGEIEQYKASVPSDFLSLKVNDSTSLDEIKQGVVTYKGLMQRLFTELYDLPKEEEMIKVAENWYANSSSSIHFRKLISIAGEQNKNWKKLSSFLMPDNSFNGMPLQKIMEYMRIWNNNPINLYEWGHCNHLEIWFNDKAYTTSFLNMVKEGVAVDEVFQIMLASYYRTYAEHTMQTKTILSRYSNKSFEENVRLLNEAEKKFRSFVIDSLHDKLDSSVNLSEKNNGELQQVQRFIGSKGKRKSIRSLFQDCAKFITDICPCFLMSPLSVAQYLEPGKQVFNLVIFDEASQIPTCKAIGSIARGQNLVVVGDSKQMPPTSFFSKSVFTEDEYNSEVEKLMDLDSILDDCMTLGLPQIKLDWHYRSESESLIYFSNSHYYNYLLKTYPSVDSQVSKVILKKVKGYYQPSNNEPNPYEAEAIVHEIKNRLENPKTANLSMGIITFNEKQQSLIANKLDVLFEKNNKLAKLAHWDESEIDCPAKLIVKNLENIQGDERDVIFLSVTFGKTKAGRFSTNFGPISLPGGEKRLNVAFSRAKKEMEVFTIIDMNEISTKVIPSRGGKDLMDFLQFANGKNMTIRANEKSHEGIVQDIAHVMKDNGYQMKLDVGLSEFRVDIAIINPSKPESFYCGILLDGDNLRTSSLTNDRYILHRTLLKNRGWQIIPIRSIDWWTDREKAKNELLAQIAECTQIVETLPKKAEEQSKPIENEPTVIETSIAETYQICSLDVDKMDPNDFCSLETDLIEQRYKKIIMFEGPIVDDLLEKRVCNSFGLKKRGKNIRAFMDDILNKADFVKTKQIDTEGTEHLVLWPDSYREYGNDVENHYTQFRKNPTKIRNTEEYEEDTFSRAIQEYPQIELFNVMTSLIKDTGGYIREVLIHSSISKLEFKRKGNIIIETLGLVLKNALLEGKLYKNNETGRIEITILHENQTMPLISVQNQIQERQIEKKVSQDF